MSAAVSSSPAKKQAAKTKVKKARAAPAHPKTLDMVTMALQSLNDKQGSSAVAIRTWILANNKGIKETHLKSTMKKALAKGLETGAVARPGGKGATVTGLRGRFKLGKVKATVVKKPVVKAKKPVVKKVTKKVTEKKPKAKKTPTKAKKSKATPKKTVKKATPKKSVKKVTKKVVKAKKPVKKSPAKKTTKKAAKK